jgi:ATP-dependent DNA helicase RecQ
LINQGLCEIAFHQQNKILTSLAREVLFEGDKVQLTTVQKINTEKTELKETKTNRQFPFETLRDCVMQFLKKKMFLPIIFSDALRQMETIRPMSDDHHN